MKNDSGFALVGLLLVVVAFSVSVSAGYYVWSENIDSDRKEQQDSLDAAEEILVPVSEKVVPIELEYDSAEDNSSEPAEPAPAEAPSVDDIFGDPPEAAEPGQQTKPEPTEKPPVQRI